jgi:SH3 domain protein
MSTDAIQLDDQNKRLKQQLIDNERHIDDIESENRRLLARSNREWFIVGAAVVTFGIILGLIIPRMRWQKKSSWGDF